MEACEIPRWQLLKSQLENLDPVAFKDRLRSTQKALLLDVRTAEEVQEFSLSHAFHLDYFAEDFLDRLESLDRDTAYFIYCRTGRRSVRTGILMRNWGFSHLINLEGGLVAWQQIFGDASEI